MEHAYEYIQAMREGARRRLTLEFVRFGLTAGGRVFYAPYASREAVPIDDVRTEDDGELVYHT